MWKGALWSWTALLVACANGPATEDRAGLGADPYAYGGAPGSPGVQAGAGGNGGVVPCVPGPTLAPYDPSCPSINPGAPCASAGLVCPVLFATGPSPCTDPPEVAWAACCAGRWTYASFDSQRPSSGVCGDSGTGPDAAPDADASHEAPVDGD